MPSWTERAGRAAERYEDGAARLPDDPDERQRQLTRMANAAWAAGLSLLMSGDQDEGRAWLVCAAERYRESWALAPPDSWGRPIGAMKARLVAGDLEGAARDAEWGLSANAERSASPIGRYAAGLALLVLGRDERASPLAARLRDRDDFPTAVADALVALAAGDANGYDAAIRGLLADFESRGEFLEDVPVADTVLALEALAEPRGIAVGPRSALLPPA
ncbi:MAG TPA: hypothetical protein VFK76_01835 [Gaiellaceae bacterium]|nr:hypothetical protein [Gaiellaceae bacterium]